MSPLCRPFPRTDKPHRPPALSASLSVRPASILQNRQHRPAGAPHLPPSARTQQPSHSRKRSRKTAPPRNAPLLCRPFSRTSRSARPVYRPRAPPKTRQPHEKGEVAPHRHPVRKRSKEAPQRAQNAPLPAASPQRRPFNSAQMYPHSAPQGGPALFPRLPPGQSKPLSAPRGSDPSPFWCSRHTCMVLYPISPAISSQVLAAR